MELQSEMHVEAYVYMCVKHTESGQDGFVFRQLPIPTLSHSRKCLADLSRIFEELTHIGRSILRAHL